MNNSYSAESEIDQPLIPPVAPPKGWAFLSGTWTGRIILINTIMFLISLWKSKSLGLLAIDVNVLIDLGAKEPVLLAQGEYWRLFTPMFIHGGILHFGFNNWALYVLGYQIEHLLKPQRYLLLYFLAGIGGNLASALVSTSVSVGASGALFGLLGCGFYVERSIQSKIKELTGSKLRQGAYTGMVVANIIFGLMIPQIDNAAHIGGLIVGITYAYVLLRLKPNRLLRQQPQKALFVGAIVALLFLGAGIIGSSPKWVHARLLSSVQSSETPQEKLFYLGRMIQLDPQDEMARVHRLVISLQLKQFDLASADFLVLHSRGNYDQRMEEVASELNQLGLFEASEWLNQRLGAKDQSL